MNKSIIPAKTLKDLGFKVTASGVTLLLERDGRSWRYRVEGKNHVGRSVLGSISLAFAGDSEDRLLVTDYVTPPLADELRVRGIQFIDTAGNMFLERRGLFVFVTGRRLATRSGAPKANRVFRPSGLKIIFAIVSVDRLVEAPLRDIAAAAGVALGSVAAVIEGLRQLGFLAEMDGSRRLLHRERLATQWSEAYARLLEDSLELGRFSAPTSNWWKGIDPVRYGAQWGGETAAAVLYRRLVPERTIVYAAKLPSSMLLKYRLKADPAGSVVVRRRFWNFESKEPRPDVVPLLLIYADLLTAGDPRSLEAARLIRDDQLA